jgi:hypothetical protein
MNPGAPSTSHAVFLPSLSWVAATGFVFAGAVASRLPPVISQIIHTPLGFFLTAVSALLAIHYHMRPLGFAILFFLLCAWSTATIRTEGFVCLVENVDAVENPNKRWLVEEVLKETPKGFKTTTDTTAAVGGLSAQSGTSAGTT